MNKVTNKKLADGRKYAKNAGFAQRLSDITPPDAFLDLQRVGNDRLRQAFKLCLPKHEIERAYEEGVKLGNHTPV